MTTAPPTHLVQQVGLGHKCLPQRLAAPKLNLLGSELLASILCAVHFAADARANVPPLAVGAAQVVHLGCVHHPGVEVRRQQHAFFPL